MMADETNVVNHSSGDFTESTQSQMGNDLENAPDHICKTAIDRIDKKNRMSDQRIDECASESDLQTDLNSDLTEQSNLPPVAEDNPDNIRFKATDLRQPEIWPVYYKYLSKIGRLVKDEKGWPHFDAVFMISAIDGDGVDDVKVRVTLLLLSLILSVVDNYYILNGSYL